LNILSKTDSLESSLKGWYPARSSNMIHPRAQISIDGENERLGSAASV
jgi:hypothetical protein